MAALTRRTPGAACGAELIEFAFVLPLLLILVAGIIDFGFLFQEYEVLTNAAREGARVWVLPSYGSNDALVRVNSYLSASGITTPCSATGSRCTFTSNTTTVPLGGGLTADAVTVTLRYRHDFWVLGPLARLVGGTFGSVPLTASATMRKEVQGT